LTQKRILIGGSLPPTPISRVLTLASARFDENKKSSAKLTYNCGFFKWSAEALEKGFSFCNKFQFGATIQ
jgi:hypothetical protein